MKRLVIPDSFQGVLIWAPQRRAVMPSARRREYSDFFDP